MATATAAARAGNRGIASPGSGEGRSAGDTEATSGEAVRPAATITFGRTRQTC